MGLSDQKILCIGGVSDLSIQVAMAFQNEGAQVCLAHTDGQEFSQAGLHSKKVSLDEPAKLTDELADLDFDTVIISPSYFDHNTFMATSLEHIDSALTQNFEQSTYAAQAAANRLIDLGTGGSIIFLSSVAGLVPMVETNLFGSSLAALHVVAKMAAIDLAPHKIRVNVLALGWMAKDWSGSILTENGGIRTPSDVPADQNSAAASLAEACFSLANPMSLYMTGSIVQVDGGFTLTKSESSRPHSEPGT